MVESKGEILHPCMQWSNGQRSEYDGSTKEGHSRQSWRSTLPFSQEIGEVFLSLSSLLLAAAAAVYSCSQ